MKIVSFNILSDDYVDFHDKAFLSRYYNRMSSDVLRLENRLPRLLAKLRDLDGDVVLLQEVMTQARKALIEHFPRYYVGPIAYHEFALDQINQNRTGNLVMIRKSICRKPPAFSSFSIGFGYSVASARVQLDNGWATFHSVHLIDTPEKFQQAYDLLKHIAPKSDLVVVGGDFNSKSKRLHAPFKAMFYDAIQLDQAAYHFGTYLCEKPMIDYIYSTRPFSAAVIDNSPVMDSTRQSCFRRTLDEFGSDHYPVIAEI